MAKKRIYDRRIVISVTNLMGRKLSRLSEDTNQTVNALVRVAISKFLIKETKKNILTYRK